MAMVVPGVPPEPSLRDAKELNTVNPGAFSLPDGFVLHFDTMASMVDRGTSTALFESAFVNEQIPVSTYQPLSSVWEGTDGELIEAMLEFYPTIPPEPILDSTYNAGRFWKDSTREVASMDINPRHNPTWLRDNRDMHGVPDATFGTVVFDPPHVGPQGRDKSVKKFDVDFGATVECGKEQNWNLSYLYPPFLKEAKRVLKPEGILLAKITDQVNNHRSKWPHLDFMIMAEWAGFTVCDLIVKIRKGPMRSTKWKNAHHARKRHCFWIICRNSNNCERETNLAID